MANPRSARRTSPQRSRCTTTPPICCWALTRATGDPLAEQIHATLRQHPEGLTRSQISQALHHNQPAGQIDTALHALNAAGRVTNTQIPTGGRPAQLGPSPHSPGVRTANRYAREGRIARPNAPRPPARLADLDHRRGERSQRKRSGHKRATHPSKIPDPVPFVAGLQQPAPRTRHELLLLSYPTPP